MRRVNFTLDDATSGTLDKLAADAFGGNRSLAVRTAIETLAGQEGPHGGWVLKAFAPEKLLEPAECHCCQAVFGPGETLCRPVFERGASPMALAALPGADWLDCQRCAEAHL